MSRSIRPTLRRNRQKMVTVRPAVHIGLQDIVNAICHEIEKRQYGKIPTCRSEAIERGSATKPSAAKVL